MKMKNKLICILGSIGIVAFCFILTSSFGYYQYVKRGNKSNIIKTSNVVLEIENNAKLAINEDNSYPITDDAGKNVLPYKFKLKNFSKSNIDYQLQVVNDEEEITNDNCLNNLLSYKTIRYTLTRNNLVVSEGLLNQDGGIIDHGTIDSYESNQNTNNYELRIWMDSQVNQESIGKHFHGKVNLIVNE